MPNAMQEKEKNSLMVHIYIFDSTWTSQEE